MFDLTRTIRLCIDPAPRPAGGDVVAPAVAPVGSDSPRYNTFAGWPSMMGIGAYYELEVSCRGEADPVTGYMMNISSIDDAVRHHALPIIERAMREPATSAAHVLRDVLAAVQPALRGLVVSVRWRLTPYYSLTMAASAPDRVSIAQQFEFAAAHRLHSPSLSDAENRACFGKCNNPSGHGHNYRLEVVVAAPLDESGRRFGLPELERIVHEQVVQRFDHKHLNLDTAEFAALNPSVEHIAKVCHGLLIEPLRKAGGELQRVTVWETEKTRCTYPAEGR